MLKTGAAPAKSIFKGGNQSLRKNPLLSGPDGEPIVLTPPTYYEISGDQYHPPPQPDPPAHQVKRGAKKLGKKGVSV
jgi:hypothetical protein